MPSWTGKPRDPLVTTTPKEHSQARRGTGNGTRNGPARSPPILTLPKGVNCGNISGARIEPSYKSQVAGPTTLIVQQSDSVVGVILNNAITGAAARNGAEIGRISVGRDISAPIDGIAYRNSPFAGHIDGKGVF